MSLSQIQVRKLDTHLRNALIPKAEAALKRIQMPKDSGRLASSISFDLKLKDANVGIWEVVLKMNRYGFMLDNQARNRQYKSQSLRQLKSDSKLVKNKDLYTAIIREFFGLQVFIEKETADFLGRSVDENLQQMLDSL